MQSLTASELPYVQQAIDDAITALKDCLRHSADDYESDHIATSIDVLTRVQEKLSRPIVDVALWGYPDPYPINDEQLAVLVGYGLIESEGIEGRYRANKDNSEIVANYILNGEPIPQKPQQGK